MKVYFSGSISGGREKQEFYHELIKYINDNIGIVLTEHIGNVNTQLGNELLHSSNREEYVYLRDKKWIDECDIVIADVSITSIGVGYELGYAESIGKPIICFYDINSEKKLSFMVSGNKYNTLFKYSTIEEVILFLKKYFDQKIIDNY